MSAVPLLAGLGAVTSRASSLSMVDLAPLMIIHAFQYISLFSPSLERVEGGWSAQLSRPPSLYQELLLLHLLAPHQLPPPPSLLGGARVERPSSPHTHHNLFLLNSFLNLKECNRSILVVNRFIDGKSPSINPFLFSEPDCLFYTSLSLELSLSGIDANFKPFGHRHGVLTVNNLELVSKMCWLSQRRGYLTVQL